MSSLATSILHRPYVFAFLAIYLVLAWRLWGWRRTSLWLASGYLIAWASECSSINNGFPYGEYHYVYENLKGELLLAGVPFFDSLSYPFLIFAGYSTAGYILGSGHGTWSGAFLGAMLTMLLDVIIDPIATMGDRWFLGKIHWYANPGLYFGVPATNFAGWFLVALAVIATNVMIWRLTPPSWRGHIGKSGRRDGWPYPAFYAGIALFNIAITFWVGEWRLGIASTIVLSAIACFLARPVMFGIRRAEPSV